MKTNLTLFTQITQTLCGNSFSSQTESIKSTSTASALQQYTYDNHAFLPVFKTGFLTDVTNGLKSASGNLNHLSLKVSSSKSSWSYQNKNRESRLFQNYYLDSV